MKVKEIKLESSESENLNQEIKTASIFKRFLALMIDSITIISLGSVLAWPFSQYFSENPFVAEWIIFLTTFIYYIAVESIFFKGESLGKIVFGFIIVAEDGGPPATWKLILRRFIILFPSSNQLFGSLEALKHPEYGVYFQSAFWIFFSLSAIGVFVFSLFHKQRRGAHDILLGTRVIEKPENLNFFLGKPVKFSMVSSLASAFFLALSGYGILSLHKQSIYNTVDANLGILRDVQSEIIASTGIDAIGVSRNFRYGIKNKVTKYLVVTVNTDVEKSLDPNFKMDIENKVRPIVTKHYGKRGIEHIQLKFQGTKYFGLFGVKNAQVENFKIRASKRVPSSIYGHKSIPNNF